METVGFSARVSTTKFFQLVTLDASRHPRFAIEPLDCIIFLTFIDPLDSDFPQEIM